MRYVLRAFRGRETLVVAQDVRRDQVLAVMCSSAKAGELRAAGYTEWELAYVQA